MSRCAERAVVRVRRRDKQLRPRTVERCFLLSVPPTRVNSRQRPSHNLRRLPLLNT
jgi:hypothetical protein